MRLYGGLAPYAVVVKARRVPSWKASFSYLLDESQEVARAYDAVCTPDFFGFDGALRLQYRGRLDNLRMERGGGERSPDLLNAMREIKKAGKYSGVQLPSAGCSIKWKS